MSMTDAMDYFAYGWGVQMALEIAAWGIRLLSSLGRAGSGS